MSAADIFLMIVSLAAVVLEDNRLTYASFFQIIQIPSIEK